MWFATRPFARHRTNQGETSRAGNPAAFEIAGELKSSTFSPSRGVGRSSPETDVLCVVRDVNGLLSPRKSTNCSVQDSCVLCKQRVGGQSQLLNKQVAMYMYKRVSMKEYTSTRHDHTRRNSSRQVQCLVCTYSHYAVRLVLWT